jgi:hypothetical protein
MENAPRFSWQSENPMIQKGLFVQGAEGVISDPINFRQCASAIAVLTILEPAEVDAPLDDLRNALAGTARALEKEGLSAEPVGLKNSLICMHDVLKAYKEHHLPVPKRLTTIHQRLEQRRNEIAPQP